MPARVFGKTGTMSFHRSALVLGSVLMVSITSCANRDESLRNPTTVVESTQAPTPTSSAPSDSGAVTFGDLESPCGPAPEGVTPSVDPDQAKGSTDVIRLATASDKGATMAPGLNSELFDAAMAFSAWCNAQGGIAGLPIQIIDADAKLFEVPAQIENICSSAFAMVGGGFAFDDQIFPRFHECGMIDVPGFVVTTPKGQSDNMVAPMPNPSNLKEGGWFRWATAAAPQDMQSFATVYADLLTSQIVERQYVEIAEKLGGTTIIDRIPYNPSGESSWAPIALRLKSSGVKAMTFVGVPELMAQLLKAMDEIGYRPDLIISEAGMYADVLITRSGASADGTYVRTSYSLFEEADQVPAARDYLDMMAEYVPDGKVSGLGMQSVSAFLLFSQVARECIVNGGGVLTRGCVIDAARRITSWDGGGLHAPSNPGANEPSPCYQIIRVDNGAFVRHYPSRNPTDEERALIPSAEITEDGWACDPSTLVRLDGDYGDPSPGKIG